VGPSGAKGLEACSERPYVLAQAARFSLRLIVRIVFPLVIEIVAIFIESPAVFGN
jgi:hypothetical protein